MPHEDATREAEIAREQHHVDRVYARVEVLRQEAQRAQRQGHQLAHARTPGSLVERDAMVFHAARRLRALDAEYEGLVFGRTGRLRAAEPWFAHYWGNRAGYDPEIACRLSQAFLEGISVKEAAAAYRGRPIDLPQEVRPTRAQKIRRWLTA